MEKIICDKEDLVAIANAVRNGTGSTETFNVNELSIAASSMIGVASTAVLYTGQSLTDAQKAQARENIGVPSVDEIIQGVIDALGTPVFGRIDENKHITLSGHLANGTYTVVFEDEDGFVSEVCTINKGVPAYINILAESVDADGNPYNDGKGWKKNTRLNSSGAEATAEGTECTGFMPIKIGDVFRFENMKIAGILPEGGSNSTQYIVFYNSAKAKLHHVYTHTICKSPGSQDGYFEFDENGYWKKYDTSNLAAVSTSVNWSDLAYFRISAEEISDASIITRNQVVD